MGEDDKSELEQLTDLVGGLGGKPTKLALGVAKDLFRAIAERLSAQHTIDKVFAEQREEMIFQAVEKLEELLRRIAALEARMDDAERAERHARRPRPVTGREAAILFASLVEQAERSALPARLALMAAAAAGIFHPDLTVEIKSHAVRALGQLEPGDVVVLRDLAAAGEGDRERATVFLRAPTVSRIVLHRAALVATNKIMEGPPREVAPDEGWMDIAEDGRFEVSELGAAVLRLVDTWGSGHGAGSKASAGHRGPPAP